MNQTTLNNEYNPKDIETKWQQIWYQSGIYQIDLDTARKPFYNLMMFPYPSAEGLHVGNVYSFTGADTYGRFKAMQGHDVFEPIGFDAFSIHSENYALKINQHPRQLITRNIPKFAGQLHRLGLALTGHGLSILLNRNTIDGTSGCL